MRCVHEYHNLRKNVGDRSLRGALPRGVLPEVNEVRISRNPLGAFLKNGDDVYEVHIGPDYEVPLAKIEKAFRNHARRHKLDDSVWSDYRNVFKLVGLTLENVNACRECGTRASQKTCGEHYNAANRCKKVFVIGMRVRQRD